MSHCLLSVDAFKEYKKPTNKKYSVNKVLKKGIIFATKMPLFFRESFSSKAAFKVNFCKHFADSLLQQNHLFMEVQRETLHFVRMGDFGFIWNVYALCNITVVLTLVTKIGHSLKYIDNNVSFAMEN